MTRVFLDDVQDLSDISDLLHLDLQTISLRNCDIKEKTIRQLTKFPHLKLVRLDRASLTDEDLRVLATAPALVQLEATSCQLLTPKGILEFKKLKPNCKFKYTQNRYAKAEEMFQMVGDGVK